MVRHAYVYSLLVVFLRVCIDINDYGSSLMSEVKERAHASSVCDS